jgi:hypothetical protein
VTQPPAASSSTSGLLIAGLTFMAVGATSGVVGYCMLYGEHSDAVGIAGGVALGGGVLFVIVGFIMGVKSEPRRASLPVQVSPFVARAGGGLALRARW